MARKKVTDVNLLDKVESDTKALLGNVKTTMHIPFPVILASIFKGAAELIRESYLSDTDSE